MNVLIIGVNGFLGRAIASRSVSLGHRVFGVSRSETATPDISGIYLVGDRSHPKRIAELVIEKQINVVVDVIAMTLPETQALISELDNLVSQYVMLSSSDVYRNYELLHRKARGTPTLGFVDECSELRSTRYPYRQEPRRAENAADRYLDDYDKIPIEEAVKRLSVHWTILRLPMVYGPGDKQRRFRWAIEPMAKGEKCLLIPKAWGEFLTTYGYIDNVAAAIAITIGNSKAARQVFNVAEETPTDHFKWADRIANVMKWSGTIETTEDPDHPFARRIRALDLTVPFRIDGRRLRNQLEFSDIVDLQTALEQTVIDETNRL